MVQSILQVNAVEHLSCSRAGCLRGCTQNARRQGDIVLRRKLVQQVVELIDKPDMARTQKARAFLKTLLARIGALARQADLARAGFGEQCCDVQYRRFAAA